MSASSPELRPATGPLVWPGCPSGINWVACSHVAPQACDRCDGVWAESREAWRAEKDAERVRAQRLRDPVQRAAWLDSLPAHVRALVERPTWKDVA